jgi:hypothetical protein
VVLLWLMRADRSDPHQAADQLDVQALTGVPASLDAAA